MKTKILFVMNNLSCGGAEKALISLLQTIDYTIYSVDLFLFKKKGVFLNQVPKDVNILAEPKYYHYFDMSFKKAVFENLLKGRIDVVFYRMMAGIVFKTESNPAIKEQKVWKYLKKVMQPLNKTYDVAVGYLEKTPNYFCVDKVHAKRKFGFIHNDYNQLQMDAKIDYPYFQKLDKIITVSEECKTVLIDIFPAFKNKFEIMNNIISSKTIKRLSELQVEFNPDPKGLTIMSIGRLNNQKRYDLAINACKILIDKNINVYWYVLGDGEERENLNKLIIKNNLENRFIFLGIQDNPYPYLKKADIFLHTAEFEGFGIVITEAKILNKPMVITNFNIAKTHIEHEYNGLISEMNSKSIADNIETLHNNKSLKDSFSTNLKNYDYGNEDEILKFYKLIKNEGDFDTLVT